MVGRCPPGKSRSHLPYIHLLNPAVFRPRANPPPRRIALSQIGPDDSTFPGPAEPGIEVAQPVRTPAQIDPGIPVKLAQVLRAGLERLVVAFLQRIGALHEAAA